MREKAIKAWLAAAAVIAFDPIPSHKVAARVAQQAAESVIVYATGLIETIDFLTAHVIHDNAKFGDSLALLANFLAAHGLIAFYRCIYEGAAKSAHEYKSDHPRTPAISYAAMDEHDYPEGGCTAPGDSIEIFFDATSPKLADFIDRVISRVDQLAEGELENGGPAVFGGYISLRFMGQAEAFISMQKWPRTCSIEIAGLARVEGTEPLLKQVEADAVDFGAAVHWGQRNNWSMKNVDQIHIPNGPLGPLFRWRAALSELTDHGRCAAFSTAFSTAFSKQMGLEITDPIIGSFSIAPTEGCAGEQTTATWDAIRNPPETRAFLEIKPEGGGPARLPLDGLTGSRGVPMGTGRSTVSLVLERELNGVVYSDRRDLVMRGFAPNDPWMFTFTAESRQVAGVIRWAVEINLFSKLISNALRVAEIDCTFAGVPSWTVRHPDLGDLKFTTALTHQVVPGLPVFNKNWLFFSDTPAAGTAPVLQVAFILTC